MQRLLWILFLSAFSLFPHWLGAEERVIRVQGAASVTAPPDQGIFSMGVETRENSAQQAMKKNSDVMTKIIEALKQEGLNDQDIQTSDLNLRPVYGTEKEGNANKVIGYTVNHRLTVRTQDLKKLGALYDKASEAGANRFEGISFSIRDAKSLTQKARAAAVDDARQQAKVYAEAMGVALGRPFSLQAGQAYDHPTPLRAMVQMSSDSESIPIQAGELSFNATVDMVWEILDLVQ